MAECLTVDQDVAGSTPVSHPKEEAVDEDSLNVFNVEIT
jgi:hypothetical protein